MTALEEERGLIDQFLISPPKGKSMWHHFARSRMRTYMEKHPEDIERCNKIREALK